MHAPARAALAATGIGPPLATGVALLPFVPDDRIWIQIGILATLALVVALPAGLPAFRARWGPWLTVPATTWVLLMTAAITLVAVPPIPCSRHVAPLGTRYYPGLPEGELVTVVRRCGLGGASSSDATVYRVVWGLFLWERTPYEG